MSSQPKGPLPPPRGVPKSVSDLYGTDEIDFLLDEIKDLEPACCQLEDIQVEFGADLPPLKPPRTTRPASTTTNHNTTTNKHIRAPPTPQTPRLDAIRSAATSAPATPEKYIYSPSPNHASPYQSQFGRDVDQGDDNFILIIPSPKLSAKHYKRARDDRGKKGPSSPGGFLKRVFRRKTIEGVEQQRMVQFQTEKELHEIEVLDSNGHRKKKNKNLVVLAGRVDTTEEDEDIVPISIGEHDNEDPVEDLPRDGPVQSASGAGGDKEEDEEEKKRKKSGKKEDFDIAGSRAGGVSTDLESPLGTVTSWDSHAFYKHRIGLGQMAWGVQLHCDLQHLKTLSGIFRVLLVISSILCLAFESSVAHLFLLPLIGRLRLMVFCALFSLLVTCLMLFLDISHIAFMFPFNWSRVNAILYVFVGLLFVLGSSLILHAVLFAEAYHYVNRSTKDTLLTTSILGFACAAEAFVLSGIAICCSAKYLQVPEDQSELCERDREMRPMNSRPMSRRGKTGRRVSKRDLMLNNHHIKGGSFAGQPMDEGNEEEEEQAQVEEEEEDEDYEEEEDTDEHQVMLNSASGDDLPNHQQRSQRDSMSSFTQKPYIPAKRPDQPTLGHHNSQVKSNSRYRQGYHYHPIASTSAQSPTFVLDEDSKAIPGPSTSRSLSETT